MHELIWTAGGIGFLLGMRHALDPDHVVAVSTIASEQRSLRRSSLVGAFWGLGHGLSLMIAAALVLALKVRIGAAVGAWLENAVAVMLVVLGAIAVRRGFREWTVHAHRHAHDGHAHVHLHTHTTSSGREESGGMGTAPPPRSLAHARDDEHRHEHILGFGVRPFSVGVIHGLAGSAGLAIIAVGTTSSVAAGLIYVAMLGVGTAAGMMILTALMSLPLVLLAGRYRTLRGSIQLVAGFGSVAFGLIWLR